MKEHLKMLCTAYVADTKRCSGRSEDCSDLLLMPGGSESKVQRLIGLYDALLESRIKSDRSGEFVPLAALSLADMPVWALAERSGPWMHSCSCRKTKEQKIPIPTACDTHVMVVLDQKTGTDQVNPSMMTNTLNMLISKARTSRLSFALHVLEFPGKAFVSSKEQKGTADKTQSEETGAGKAPEQTDQ